jgi:hypothetical protein
LEAESDVVALRLVEGNKDPSKEVAAKEETKREHSLRLVAMTVTIREEERRTSRRENSRQITRESRKMTLIITKACK